MTTPNLSRQYVIWQREQPTDPFDPPQAYCDVAIAFAAKHYKEQA